ncbi:MAG: DUF4124 domain-containing protein [Pseudomonadales bacterium]|nr:DUF4124 domain-containing protein [Pseudomonadales bacterium]
MFHLKSFLIVVCLSLFSFQIQAKDFYKCVQEDGTVSYSNEEPSEGCVSVTVIHTYAGSSTKYDPLAAQGNSSDDKDDPTDKSLEEQAKAQKEELDQACEGKRKNLDILTSTARVRIKDPETGETRVLDEEEHQAKISSLKDFLDKNCN